MSEGGGIGRFPPPPLLAVIWGSLDFAPKNQNVGGKMKEKWKKLTNSPWFPWAPLLAIVVVSIVYNMIVN